MGKLKPAAIFGSGMILQRGKPIPVWGRLNGEGAVTVHFGDAIARTEAENGAWKVILPPLNEGRDLVMEISAAGETVCFEDVAMGEVWIAGGQSNMELRLFCDAEHELAYETDDPDLRFYETPRYSYEGQGEDAPDPAEGFWRHANRQELPYFSAVGFWFGKRLRQALKVPVGVVGCNWGGTSAGCWMGEEYFTPPIEKCRDEFNQKIRENKNLLDAWNITRRQNAEALDPEKRKAREAFSARALTEPIVLPANPNSDFFAEMMKTRFTPFSPFRPCGLYKTMLEKIIPYSAAGFLWYQGEEDVHVAEVYDELLARMIRCWRDRWGEELPFYIVQLPGLDKCFMSFGDEFIPIRAQQEKVARTVPKCGIVCTMDVGMAYDIHPKYKRQVGERLALLALGDAYGQDLLYRSPAFAGAVKTDGEIRVQLSDCGEGLSVRSGAPEALELFIGDSPAPDLTVEIAGNEIVYRSPAIRAEEPAQVRCLWRGWALANVYSSAGLPVLPFCETV